MIDVGHRWVEELRDSFESMRRLRDEARVHAHLARLDAKARVAELEHRLGGEAASLRKNLEGLLRNLRVFAREIFRAARRANQPASFTGHSSETNRP